MPPARMPHQAARFWFDLPDEGDSVGNVLRHPVMIGDGAVPMFGKEMPQAHRDHAVLSRQRSEYGIPGAEIAERAVDADQRVALANVQIGHVVAVDADCLHVSSPKSPARFRKTPAAPVRTSDASRW